MSSKQKILISGLIIIGILLISFFGIRSLHLFRELRGHLPSTPSVIETDVTLIRDWMTVPYIAKRYSVPDEKLFEAVHIPPQGNADKSLVQLNRIYYPDKPGFVLETIMAVIPAYQSPAEKP